MASEQQLQEFIARQRLLLSKERDAEVERTSLLLSNCGPKLLEQKGLALGGLGVASINVGLGGKTYDFVGHGLAVGLTTYQDLKLSY